MTGAMKIIRVCSWLAGYITTGQGDSETSGSAVNAAMGVIAEFAVCAGGESLFRAYSGILSSEETAGEWMTLSACRPKTVPGSTWAVVCSEAHAVAHRRVLMLSVGGG